MDEGRNTCLLFPELIDFGCTEEGQKQRRKAFEVRLVSPCFSSSPPPPAPAIGSVDDIDVLSAKFPANDLRDSCHIFYSRRVVEIMDGKPKWSGIDNRSELLDDYGNKVET